MIFFANDYAGGAHPDVLRAVVESNEELLAGYGEDPYCERAKEKIRKCCQAPQADIFHPGRYAGQYGRAEIAARCL